MARDNIQALTSVSAERPCLTLKVVVLIPVPFLATRATARDLNSGLSHLALEGPSARKNQRTAPQTIVMDP